MKLGKLPAKPDAITFKLRAYADLAELPKPPAEFGRETLVSDWKVLGNDKYGCCVFAGAAHESMLWCREAGLKPTFTDKGVLSDYAAVTGFNPNDPSTDQGTDMAAAASYRRRTGVKDSRGKRHKVGAYLEIAKSDWDQTVQAAWLFGGVGIGFNFPSSAMQQFDRGQTWDVVPGAHIDGGHYVPVIGVRGGELLVVTWGKLQRMTRAFFERFNDESVCYLSPERFRQGKTLDGFDLATLQADLGRLRP